jgi:aminoglycoside phosphotransferase (APT) family kinase protein
MDPTDFWAYMAHHPNAYPHYQAVVFPHLLRSEQQWVEAVFAAYIARIRVTPFPICMTHSDMWVFHIIVDPKAHTLSGVIDFGLRIADPARDFKAFELYGQDFVAEVYRHYHAPVDEHFEQRRLFYTAHDLVFEFARALSGDDARKSARHKQALSAYIATHPA